MCKKRCETTFRITGQEDKNKRWNDEFWEAVQDSAVTYRHSVGELRQDGIDWRWNVNFVGYAHLPPKQEKACCWLSQQALSAFYGAAAQ